MGVTDVAPRYMIMHTRVTTAAIALAAAVPLEGGPVNGVVPTTPRPGVPAATAIVYAEPLDAPPGRAPRQQTLGQKNKTFQPRLLAVTVGSTVDFPNNDPIFHNVFSLSGPQP